jgi:hypothetical protein
MAIAWTVEVNGVNITNNVIEASFAMGRENILDDYAANTCTITVRNGTGAFNPGSYPISSLIFFTPNTASGKSRVFWLQTIEYRDEIDSDASTATIVGIDGYGRLGQFLMRPNPYFSGNYLTNRTINQSDDYVIMSNLIYGYGALGIDSMSGFPNPPEYSAGDSFVPTLGFVAGGAQEEIDGNRTLLDYMNSNNRTERGSFDIVAGGGAGKYWGISRTKTTQQKIGVSIGNTSSSTSILWDEFSRVGLGGNYFNVATVSNPLGATQTATGTASAGTGITQLSVEARDLTTAQQASNASWIAQTLSAPGNIYATISFLDGIQNTTALATFLAFTGPVTGWLPVTYQDPGTGLQTRDMKIEGIRVSIVPGATRFILSLSDMANYSFFTLNNTDLGVLNSDRLGW